MRRLAALLTVLFIAGPGAPLASAMTLTCGPTLCFEFDQNQAAIATLGLPVRVGDSVQFLPPAFLAQSAGGVGTVQASATFVFERVFTVGGGEIASLQWRQEGDYETVAGGTVRARIDLAAESNLGPDLAGTFAIFDGTSPSGGPSLWSISASLTPATSFGGPANDLKVSLQFLLEATTAGAGSFAFLQSKFVLGEGAAIPAPGALALFATAAGLCAARARRRRKQ